MADDEKKKAKQAEIDRKRAEVRARLEEASKAKKAKKGFMTPERKKKLRVCLFFFFIKKGPSEKFPWLIDYFNYSVTST